MTAISQMASPLITHLLQATPSGAMKLTAAWDGLHTETRISILVQLLREDAPTFPLHSLDNVLHKALVDSNPYVRYLAVRKASSRWYGDKLKEDELHRRIERDVDPLVRYSLLEYSATHLSPSDFFALPQEARLATVRALEGSAK